MNSVTAPARACASFTKATTSAVRSVNPAPRVWTVRSDVTRVAAPTVESAARDDVRGEVMNVSHCVVPANAGTHSHRCWLWQRRLPLPFNREAAAYGSRRSPGRLRIPAASNPAGDVLLHPVGHVDQPPPGLLQKRHHRDPCRGRSAAEFRSCARRRHLRFGLFQRVRLRQRLVDLAGDGRLARRAVPP